MEIIFLLLKQRFKDYIDDKADIFAGLLSNVLYILATLLSFEVLFKYSDQIGGLTKNEFYFLFGLSQIVVSYIFVVVYPMGVKLIEIYLDDTISIYLTKPVSLLKIVHFSDIDFNGLFIGVTGVVILILNPIQTTPLNALFGSTLYLMSYILTTSLFVTFGSLSCLFRTEAIASFLNRIMDVLRYPLAIFPKMFQLMLIFILPFGLICYIPLKAFLGKLSVEYLIAYVFVFSLNLLISILIWKYTLYRYRKG